VSGTINHTEEQNIPSESVKVLVSDMPATVERLSTTTLMYSLFVPVDKVGGMKVTVTAENQLIMFVPLKGTSEHNQVKAPCVAGQDF
jgi:hypothetical protein